MRLPPIYFYIPQSYWPSKIPASADKAWKGFGIGIYAWTLQTYLRLKADGFPCELVPELPEEGIVLLHRNSLRVHNQLKPAKNLLLICLKAELSQYPYAQLQVVQNPTESKTFKNSYYLPHWPQPGLIPRNPTRGDRFENIAFFGHLTNLAAELLEPDWQRQIQGLGLNWCPRLNCNRWDNYDEIDDYWHDYSNIDAVVAVRSFERLENYLTKPATKLYNAWLAGVPAVLGCESAYRAERQSEFDYLEVATPAELIVALKRLREHPKLREAIVKNGQIRAQAIQPSQITAKWRSFLEDIAVPTYYLWCSKPRWWQQVILRSSYLAFGINRLQDKGLTR